MACASVNKNVTHTQGEGGYNVSRGYEGQECGQSRCYSERERFSANYSQVTGMELCLAWHTPWVKKVAYVITMLHCTHVTLLPSPRSGLHVQVMFCSERHVCLLQQPQQLTEDLG